MQITTTTRDNNHAMTGIHGRKIKKRKIERKNIVADGKEKEMYSKMKNHHDSRLEQKEARLKIAAKTGGQFNEIDVFGPPKSAQLPGIGCSSSSATMNQMDRIKANSRFHVWHWDETDKSHESLVSQDRLGVCFHPQCSESTAAIRGSEPLVQDGNYYYWEVSVLNKVYGTSVMFGLCTKDQQLHLDEYRNLIGLDKNGWSLSHKGLIWHNGTYSKYTDFFPENQPLTVGMFFDTKRGELSFFRDGVNLGVAFRGLNEVKCDLYPVVGSTAKCIRMKLQGSYCGYTSLMERSCFTIIKNSRDRVEIVKQMMKDHLPKSLVYYLAETALICSSQAENDLTQQRRS